MKSIFIYSLLAIICFQSGAYLAIFKVRQWSIQDEMSRSHKYVETFSIPTSYYELHKQNHGKEIIWKGALYDIKSITHKGNTVFLKAIRDKKEESLLTEFSNFLKAKDKRGENATKQFNKLLKMDWWNEIHPLIPLMAHEIERPFIKIERTQVGFPGHVSKPPQLPRLAIS